MATKERQNRREDQEEKKRKRSEEKVVRGHKVRNDEIRPVLPGESGRQPGGGNDSHVIKGGAGRGP